MRNDNLFLKNHLREHKDGLSHHFFQNKSILTITRKLVHLVDEVLILLFRKHGLHQSSSFCLVALGSYGRRELQLHSDIDLLLLHEEFVPQAHLELAELFIQDCWDVGLEISHQLTSVNTCAQLASQDLSVISSILDMRLICGKGALMEQLSYETHPAHMWNSHDYFFAKKEEQLRRYEKYGETAYNLEPNVKYGAGGLRDLQVLSNIGKRHFHIKKLANGIYCGFITAKEYEELIYCQHFLWRVRFALHTVAQKKEERLLFDYQLRLAALFGYQDKLHSLAIEQFMKAYFKVIKRSRELNEMLLQWFAETIVFHEKQKLIPLDGSFQLSNHYLEVRHSKVFIQNPDNLLHLFLWLVKNPLIEGVRASTIRLVRQNLYLIDKRFSASKSATQLFMKILKTENNPYDALQRMSRYGVLGRYLDCFAAVTGQMQYDLFHVYTVDQHTLFVIRNLARFLNPQYETQFPLCCQLMPSIPKREILYLAALFHDIAKGRGGDHSELGAQDAETFALQHSLNKKERALLSWLVRHHLLMSQTAQRQDIYDPKTVQKFCGCLPAAHYLDYLYLLTVADICGTNPSLWNAWKDSLLKELYYAAKKVLHQERALIDEKTIIDLRKKQAFNLLAKEKLPLTEVTTLWESLKNKYFLHEQPHVIARHTKAILASRSFPLVLIMPHHSMGGTEVFIYMPHREDRFSVTTTVLNNHHVTIQEATILTCNNQFDLDTYIVLDDKNHLLDEERSRDIQQALMTSLANTHLLPTISRRRLSRTQAHFKIKPKITFSTGIDAGQTQLFLITGDKPGLLARISRVFLRENIFLHNAKIATAGERVEDNFYISNQQGQALNPEDQERLKQLLISELTS